MSLTVEELTKDEDEIVSQVEKWDWEKQQKAYEHLYALGHRIGALPPKPITDRKVGQS